MLYTLRKLTALICKTSCYHRQVPRNTGLRPLQAPASPAVPGFHLQQISPWLGQTSLPFIGPELSHLPAINHSQERSLGLPWSDLIDLIYLWSNSSRKKKRERDWELSNLSVSPERTWKTKNIPINFVYLDADTLGRLPTLSFTHLFNQEMSTDYLMCAQHCARHWGHRDEQKRHDLYLLGTTL